MQHGVIKCCLQEAKHDIGVGNGQPVPVCEMSLESENNCSGNKACVLLEASERRVVM
jgi:hypothetical protein